MVFDEIRDFLKDYFEVLQTQDFYLFDRVFHPRCVLYSQQAGELKITDLDQYREIIKNRESAQKRGFLREESILMLDLLSPTMALVKVRLRLFDAVIEDYLNVMKHEGRWMVYAKHPSKVQSSLTQ
jgi:Putative lumazine-binding